MGAFVGGGEGRNGYETCREMWVGFIYLPQNNEYICGILKHF